MKDTPAPAEGAASTFSDAGLSRLAGALKSGIHSPGNACMFRETCRAASPEAAPSAGMADLLAKIRALPMVRANEIDGEESDGTPRSWRNRPYVSLTQIERLLSSALAQPAPAALTGDPIYAVYVGDRRTALASLRENADFAALERGARVVACKLVPIDAQEGGTA